MRFVLVTGFEPFGGDAQNPSGEVACALDAREIAGRQVRGAVLPCVFGDSLVALRHLLEKTNPVAVLCLGVAANRREITPERIAMSSWSARATWQAISRRPRRYTVHRR